MENTQVRPEAIKLNASSVETFKKEFVFLTADEIEVVVPFEIDENYINMVLNQNEGMDLIAELYPGYFENNEVKEEFVEEIPYIILGMVVDEATKKANLDGINNSALKEISRAIMADKDVEDFFVMNGLLQKISNE